MSVNVYSHHMVCALWLLDRFIQHVGSGMGLYLDMEGVGIKKAKVSSLGLPRLFCEVP